MPPRLWRSFAVAVAVAMCVSITHATFVPLSHMVMVRAGGSANIALRSDGTVWTWGDNSVGQLGDGTTTPSLTPNPVVCGEAAGDPDHCSPDGHLKGAVSVAAGSLATIVLLDNGHVLVWGLNSRFNNFINSVTPVYVVCGVADSAHCDGGVITNATQIAVGFSHYLILLDDGTVLAWGTNNNGNLGDGLPGMPSAKPVQVSGLGSASGVTSIVAGFNHSLALKADGMVVGWGANIGQLGDGSAVPRSTPVPVVCRVGDLAGSDFCTTDGYLRSVAALSVGNSISAALLNDGSVLAWGSNNSGQVGDGTTTVRRTPTDVCAPGALAPCSVAQGNILQGVTSLTGSSLSSGVYAVTSNGALLAWGSNSNGQIGDGTTTSRTTPVQVAGLGPASGVVAVSGGDAHALVLKSNGTAFAWGSNTSGQLGNGAISASLAPIVPFGLGSGSGVIALASRAQFTLALRSDGTVLAWGSNSNGQLGDGTPDNRNTPVNVACRAEDTPGSAFCSGDGHLQGVTAIAAGNGSYALALLADGHMLAWGSNTNGQLGDGTMTQRMRPVYVCAVGALVPCAPENGNVLQGVSAIAAAGMSSYARTVAGELQAWGNNGNGFLGDGTNASKPIPINVRCRAGDAAGTTFCSAAGFLQGVAGIKAGANAPIALMADGTLLSWGLNLIGQVGDGTGVNRNLPVNVCAVGATAPCLVANGNVLQGISAVAGTGNGGFAVMASGSMSAWGGNGAATIGDGTTANRFAPVHVCAAGAAPPCSPALGNVLQGVANLGAGGSTAYAVLSDGAVFGWGANSSGQVGDGTLISRLTPAAVSGLGGGSGVISVSGGAAFGAALKTDGTVLAWGANSTGELGDGTVYVANLTPAPVLFDDITPPTLTFGLPSPPAPNGANGWYVTDVSVPWTGADAHSQLAATNPASPLVLTAEGAAVSGSVTLCDIATNCATFQSAPVKIDKTAPQVAFTASPDLIWPPNHKLVQVQLSVTASDNLALTAQPIVSLTVIANEPGAVPVVVTPGAFVFAPGSSTAGQSETVISLLADRTSTGMTRIYTISGTVQDAAGYSTPFSTTVVVARNR